MSEHVDVKADLVSEFVCRLLGYMDSRAVTWATKKAGPGRSCHRPVWWDKPVQVRKGSAP
jgi:hypothetical protein